MPQRGQAGMEKILEYLDFAVDVRESGKVRHKIKDCIALTFLADLSNAEKWEDVETFGKEHEEFLRQYLELPYGILSHDTIQRVFAAIWPEFLQGFRDRWNELLSSGEGEKIRKLLAIDGKTQCGNGNQNQKANHIVSAVDENGICIGEKLVDEKSNEITAIPQLLDDLNIKGNIITIDAMGTQKEIAKKIRKKRADYVLALKKNHGNLYDDVKTYFDDPDFLNGCEYKKTTEKARGGIEKREYWQTEDIRWLEQKKEWAGLKSIAMTRNTITKNGETTTETRYFISSLSANANEISRAIRGHWIVESYHWHLDVTFREDENRTLEKQAAFNRNIMKKLALNVLKIIDVGKKSLSLARKRFAIGTNPEKHLKHILSL
jgi:predicted transposase YbfD/YdcC